MEQGRVTVNGRRAEKGIQVDIKSDLVCFDGKPAELRTERVVIAYHKPAGIVCSTKDQGRERNNIVDALGLPYRIYPVGRLDKASTGLILLTNDGELTDRLLRARNGHEKVYEVKTDPELSDEALDKMRKGGIPIEEKRSTKPCRISRDGPGSLRITLTEGMNREIRKLVSFFGAEVISLKRVSFAGIGLGNLKEGEYRFLDAKELYMLDREGSEKAGEKEKR